ncbi:MAG TPA: lysylphosphatidylglycerol synthase domain-containing protein [Lysobacter sp.]|nr:lysylphosphatidylglycerol synthase domain-containing protein [Lysobacter sp.]
MLRSGVGRLIAWVTACAALAFVGYLLVEAWRELAVAVQQVEWPLIASGWAISVGSAVANFMAFVLLLGPARGGLSLGALGHLYFAGQLLKHLPGRVWGLAYQGAALTGRIGVGEWVSVNVAHILLGISFTVLICAGVVATVWWVPAVAVIPLIGSALLICAWREAPARWLLRHLGWLPTRVRHAIRDAMATVMSRALRSRARICLVFLSSWILYFCAWTLYARAYPGLDAWDGVRLSALYSIAWLVGYLALITPSGLGIREAVFAALAVSYPGEVVLYFSLLGRVALLATDLALGLIFLRPRHEPT